MPFPVVNKAIPDIVCGKASSWIRALAPRKRKDVYHPHNTINAQDFRLQLPLRRVRRRVGKLPAEPRQSRFRIHSTGLQERDKRNMVNLFVVDNVEEEQEFGESKFVPVVRRFHSDHNEVPPKVAVESLPKARWEATNDV